jgi:hypothetical protein
MARGIEVDANVLLGLILGEGRAGGDRVSSGSGKIVHLDIQVNHHLLIAGTGRPRRPAASSRASGESIRKPSLSRCRTSRDAPGYDGFMLVKRAGDAVSKKAGSIERAHHVTLVPTSPLF